MDSDREEWAAFLIRWADLVDLVTEQYPGFWEDLGDELRERRERQRTTRGAVVREFPPVREIATQAESRGRAAGVQAVPPVNNIAV